MGTKLLFILSHLLPNFKQIQRDPVRLQGKPVGVVQYNPTGDLKTLCPDDADRLMNHSNGSLIAVDYLARAAGVKRNQRGDEARSLCPELQLVQVPTNHGKSDLTVYRDAGREVLKILGGGGGGGGGKGGFNANTHSGIKVERASIDECYLDLTEEAQRRVAAAGGVLPLPHRPQQVHIYSSCGEDQPAEEWFHRPAHEWAAGERLLSAGAAIVADLRAAVEEKLKYTCSAGIAHSRLLAKLCSGLHKPAQQTIVPAGSVESLLAPLPLGKLRGLGGKFGHRVSEELKVETVGQLSALSLAKLEATFGDKDGQWLFNLARGVDDMEVEERRLPKSISCGKTFRGKFGLSSIEAIHTWLLELAAELEERIAVDKEDNQRSPQTLTVSIGAGNSTWHGATSVSRSCPLRRPEAGVMAADAVALVKRWTREHASGWLVTDLFLAATNFVDVQATSITKFFKPAAAAVLSPSSSPHSLHVVQDKAAAVVLQEDEHLEEEEEEGVGKRVPVENPPPPIEEKKLLQPHDETKIDESVFSELPVEIQRELRAQMKFEEIQSRAGRGRKEKIERGGGQSGNAKKKRPQQTLQESFFAGGKRSKHS